MAEQERERERLPAVVESKSENFVFSSIQLGLIHYTSSSSLSPRDTPTPFNIIHVPRFVIIFSPLFCFLSFFHSRNGTPAVIAVLTVLAIICTSIPHSTSPSPSASSSPSWCRIDVRIFCTKTIWNCFHNSFDDNSVYIESTLVVFH